MTTQTVPQPNAFGSVEYFTEKLRQGSDATLADRVLGAVGSLVAAEAQTLVTELRNLLAAEKIVAAEQLDGMGYQRELDPEQTGAPVPSYVEGHGERGRGTGAWD